MQEASAFRKLLAISAFTFLTLCLAPRAVETHVALPSAREMAEASPHVVVAVVEGRESRWNAERSLIVTDYALRIEDRLRGGAPDRITISIPGGTVGNTTDETCLTVHLEPGARYLLFLGDLDAPALSPITGARLGAFRERERFKELVAAARELVAKVEAAPAAPQPKRAAGPLPAKTYSPAKFVAIEPARAPIVFNLLPLGAPFSPADQQAAAYWNLYAGDLFRAASPPAETWSFGNGVFDFAGFPTDEQMSRAFGSTWGDIGQGVLGVAFVRRQAGSVVEADIALNPAQTWTLDLREGTRRGTGTPYPFQEVMLHELGHAWGLKHPWETQNVGWDSVLNYKSKAYYLGVLTADDTTAARTAYPGISLRDGLISSYTTRFQVPRETPLYIPTRSSVSSVRRGGTFSLTEPIKVENAGTVPLAQPAIEVYLVPQRFSFEGAVSLKKLRVRGTLPPSAVKLVSFTGLRVPPKTPPGTYHLAFLLRDPLDAYTGNNAAWSNFDVTVTITP